MTVEHRDLDLASNPSLSRDEVSNLLWDTRTQPGAVTIRVEHATMHVNRDIERALEHWLGSGKITRQTFEEAIGAIDTLRRVLSIPITN